MEDHDIDHGASVLIHMEGLVCLEEAHLRAGLDPRLILALEVLPQGTGEVGDGPGRMLEGDLMTAVPTSR